MSDTIALQTKYGKLSALVDHVLTVDLDLSVNHYFNRYLGAAKWYLVNLKTKKMQEPKTVLLDVSDVRTVTLPVDFVDWCKVGEQYGQYVRTLSLNMDMNKLDRTSTFPFFDHGSPGLLPNGIDIGNYGGWPFVNYNGATLWGIGGGLPQQGHFIVKTCDNACSELLLDISLCSNQVYLEYIGLGINPCGETFVPPYLWESVRRALLFFNEESKKVGRSESALQRLGRDLWTAEMEMRGANNDLSPDTVITLTRQAYRLTNKI